MAHLLDLLLELSHSRLAAVVPNERRDSVVRQLDVGILESCPVLGLRSEVPTCDRGLLLGDVAAHFEHLHSVEKRSGDRVERVGGADEEDAREVDGDVELRRAESQL